MQGVSIQEIEEKMPKIKEFFHNEYIFVETAPFKKAYGLIIRSADPEFDLDKLPEAIEGVPIASAFYVGDLGAV